MIANWAGNVRFQPRRMHRPRSMDELRRALHGHERVRVVGSAHSFTGVADTEGVLIDLAEMPRGLDVDSAVRRVRVSGGWTYGDLCPRLHEAGWALDNLASLPHVSVAGACATATHGSGRRLGCLATQIEEVEMLTADGEVVTLAHGAERFPAAAVSLGALGIVTALTLRVRPAFSMIQHVHERVSLDAIAAELEATMARAYSVCLFTAWEDQPHADAWVKRVVADGAAATDEETDADPLFGVPATSRDRHPQPEGSADACTEQRTVGPWHVRLPHFRPDRTPASGDELQTEYFVPWENASAAIATVSALGADIRPVLLLTEIRAVAADRLWLSPFCGRDSLAIHFSWRNDWQAVRAVLPRLEEALAPHRARPHWGKLFTYPRDYLEHVYGASMQRFRDAARALDPQGRFRNDFLDRWVFDG